MQIDSFFSFAHTLSIYGVEWVFEALIKPGKELIKMSVR